MTETATDAGDQAGNPASANPAGGSPATETPRGGGDRKATGTRRSSSTRNVIEWIAVVVAAVVVALLVKTFLVQAFRIPSESMNPTLIEGDRVLVNKLSYRLHDINRGDVIVFARPPGLEARPGEPEDLIKRVVGVPGDTLVARDGELYVNDRKLEEPYLEDGVSTTNLDQPVTLGDDEVFVMGDNRTNSQDSRVFGPVKVDTVVGRAFVVMWPPGRLSTL